MTISLHFDAKRIVKILFLFQAETEATTAAITESGKQEKNVCSSEETFSSFDLIHALCTLSFLCTQINLK